MYTIETPVGKVYIENGKVTANEPVVEAKAQEILRFFSRASLLEPDPDYTNAETIAEMMKGRVVEQPRKIIRPGDVIY